MSRTIGSRVEIARTRTIEPSNHEPWFEFSNHEPRTTNHGSNPKSNHGSSLGRTMVRVWVEPWFEFGSNHGSSLGRTMVQPGSNHGTNHHSRERGRPERALGLGIFPRPSARAARKLRCLAVKLPTLCFFEFPPSARRAGVLMLSSIKSIF